MVPVVSQNEDVMREWNFLNKIMSADPIDPEQLNFFLHFANKNTPTSSGAFTKSSPNGSGSSQNIPESNPNKLRSSDFNTIA